MYGTLRTISFLYVTKIDVKRDDTQKYNIWEQGNKNKVWRWINRLRLDWRCLVLHSYFFIAYPVFGVLVPWYYETAAWKILTGTQYLVLVPGVLVSGVVWMV